MTTVASPTLPLHLPFLQLESSPGTQASVLPYCEMPARALAEVGLPVHEAADAFGA